MRVTTVSGTPEELVQFFNNNQAVPATKDSVKASRQGYLGKWSGGRWNLKSRQINNSGGLNSPEMKGIIIQILREDLK